jgi:hypothetical protein
MSNDKNDLKPVNSVDGDNDNIIVNVKDLNFYYGNYHLLKSINLYFKKIRYARF